MAKNRRRKKQVLLEEKQSKLGSIILEIILWILEIAVGVLLGFLLVRYGAEKMTVSGSSMETVLNNEDSVIIEKLTKKIKDYKRFDVIAFQQNGKDHSYYNIKRIIGLPGETVQIIGGEVYIDGKALEDKYAGDGMANAGVASKEILLEENEYFVLGDNRNNSEDSRFANIGNVVEQDIIGRVWIRISPSFSFVSLLEPEEPEQEEENS